MSETKKPEDVVRPVLVGPNGAMVAVRTRDGVNEIVGLTRAPEGKPIMGEAVALRSRGDGAYDCETITGRPVRASNAAYRSGWEAIFGEGKGGGENQPN